MGLTGLVALEVHGVAGDQVADGHFGVPVVAPGVLAVFRSIVDT